MPFQPVSTPFCSLLPPGLSGSRICWGLLQARKDSIQNTGIEALCTLSCNHTGAVLNRAYIWLLEFPRDRELGRN